MTNARKTAFLEATRRYYQHTHLLRTLHNLIRDIAPHYGSMGSELIGLVQKYDSLLTYGARSALTEVTQLPGQIHLKLYELAPHLGGDEKYELLSVMMQLEDLHPHLYQRS
jgi:hypothetical protein